MIIIMLTFIQLLFACSSPIISYFIGRDNVAVT